jgi:hypothetical protein
MPWVVAISIVLLLALSGCAYIVTYCDGATAACGTTSTIDAVPTTSVPITVPISAIPGL